MLLRAGNWILMFWVGLGLGFFCGGATVMVLASTLALKDLWDEEEQ